MRCSRHWSGPRPGATWSRPSGGYFLWLDLPGTDTGELLARAEAAGVAFVAGRDFFPPGAGGAESVRLAYSAVGVTEIELGSSGCSRSSASRREPEPS